jgi:hypothetical protein
MEETRNKITAPQLFCLVFCCVFPGLRLYCGESFAAVLFVCLFCAVVCVVSAAASDGYGSFSTLCRTAFGGFGAVVRAFAVILLALPLSAALDSLARGVSSFYEKDCVGAVLTAAVFLCVFAASKGICTLGRFCELCVFSLALVLPLSLLGGGGGEVDVAFGTEEIDACFAAFGGAPVFFSLYLRCAKREEQSDFARASAFSPQPAACGVLGVLAAGAVHIFLIFTGAESILSSFLLWFAALGRIFAFVLSVCDVLSLPECEKTERVKKTAIFFAVYAAVWLVSARLPEKFGLLLAVCNVVFSCAVFVAIMMKKSFISER